MIIPIPIIQFKIPELPNKNWQAEEVISKKCKDWYDETISKHGDSITRILIIQENDFATMWKKVLVDITTLDTIIKNK